MTTKSNKLNDDRQLSPETLALFAELLGQVSLPANHPDFDAQARRLSLARRELEAAIEAAAPEATIEPNTQS